MSTAQSPRGEVLLPCRGIEQSMTLLGPLSRTERSPTEWSLIAGGWSLGWAMAGRDQHHFLLRGCSRIAECECRKTITQSILEHFSIYFLTVEADWYIQKCSSTYHFYAKSVGFFFAVGLFHSKHHSQVKPWIRR